MRKKEKQKIPWQEKTAAHIAGKIIAIHMRVSRRLQKLEHRLTVKQKKVGLFVFCLFGSIYLLYLLGNALFFEQPPRYHTILPGQERTMPLPDSGGVPHTLPKQFIH